MQCYFSASKTHGKKAIWVPMATFTAGQRMGEEGGKKKKKKVQHAFFFSFFFILQTTETL